MKNILLILVIIVGMPVLADIVRPDIPIEEYYKVRAEKQTYQQRHILLKRVCGDDLYNNKKSCKAKLKKEMKEIERLIDESY